MSKIITLGNDILSASSLPAENFDNKLGKLINNMYKIMIKSKGVGLAAVQIGELVRVFITHVPDDKPRVFINPEILQTSLEEDSYEEGCLSIPGINYDVIRPIAVKIQAWNQEGRHFTMEAHGLLARVIQHEYDHLEGKLFIDRITTEQRDRLVELYNKKQSNKNRLPELKK